MKYATIESQLGAELCTVEDTEEITALRAQKAWAALGTALCAQYRYREAADAFGKALRETPEDLLLLQRFAGANLTLRRFVQAKEAYRKCLALGAPKEKIAYPLGVAYDLEGAYGKAAEAFAQCYPCDEEQEIANLYWHTFSACRAGIPTELLGTYREGMQIGHHIAYEQTVRLFLGRITAQEALAWLAQERDELNIVIGAYGICGYLESRGRTEDCLRLREALLTHTTFWPCISYLAAWNDANPGKEA